MHFYSDSLTKGDGNTRRLPNTLRMNDRDQSTARTTCYKYSLIHFKSFTLWRRVIYRN